MGREKLMAVIVAFVMIGSIGGFAFSFIGISPQNPSQNSNNPQQTINSSVIERELTSREVSLILQAGGIIIENFYLSDCQQCEEGNRILEDFAIKFGRFIILSQVPIEPISTAQGDTEEKLRMLAGTGQIVDLDRTNITENYLLDTFCEISQVQPAECLLRQI